MAVTQRCPICSATLRAFPRYPRYLCSDCAEQARSAEGRPLAFSNVDASGGYRAEYADTHEPYGSHRCFVNGVECHADEHRFRGIVLQTLAAPEPAGSTRPSPQVSQPHRCVPAPANAALADCASGVLIVL